MYAVFMKNHNSPRVRSKIFDTEDRANGFAHGFNYANKSMGGNATAWTQFLPSPPRPSLDTTDPPAEIEESRF